MQVKQLEQMVKETSPSYSSTELGMLEYRGDFIIDKSSGRTLNFTEDSLQNFVQYMEVPFKFFDGCKTSLQQEIIKHQIEKFSSSPATISTYGDSFWNLYQTKTNLIPNLRMAEAFTKIFDGEAKVSRFDPVEGLLLNIQTQDIAKEVKVGDITNGGIRLFAPIGKSPYVSAYMERLVCSNGMVTTNEFDALSIRGRTVDEIIVEMEQKARKILNEDVPAYLENWQRLQDIKSANPEQLIHRLTREAGVSEKIESAIIERAAGLESNSYYDVINLITSLQHEEGVGGTQLFRLQALGGNAIRDMGGHRCNNCQHNLS